MRHGTLIAAVPLIVVSLGVAYAIARKSSPKIIKRTLMLDSKRINVLVYSGAGTIDLSRAQTLNSLKIHLGGNYAVQTVTANQLKNEPWEDTTALLVIPGGPDLNYVRDLECDGTAKIRKFVESGGRYLGICGGGYFGASEVQFEKGTPLEVCGPRDLKFFPGVAKGCVYPGFEYDSLRGSKAPLLDFKGKQPARVFYNGGCHFELPAGAKIEGIEEIANYADSGKVAIVGCRIGSGIAVLSGVHLEYSPSVFNHTDPYVATILPDLNLGDPNRTEAFRNMLRYLSLSLDENPTLIAPPLSNVFLVAQPTEYDKLTSSLSYLSTPFLSVCPGKGHTIKFAKTREEINEKEDKSDILPVVVCKETSMAETGFDSSLFFKNLNTRYIGKLLMCAQTVTSTQTIMMDHFMTMKEFPGLVFTAITQVSGRGRGSNVWVSPHGTTATSFQLPPLPFKSVLFIEYILAISIVHVIKTVTKCEDLDINIKWPNDIYYNKRLKISGILISSNLDMDDSSMFHPVVGFGLNLWNTKPTTCVNEIIREYNEKHGTNIEFFSREVLLAKILSQFEEHFSMFTLRGFGSLEQLYYKYWMHSQQQVTIESDGTTVTIQGLTKEGYLLATAKDGRQYELHPDQNSFDLMHGLLKKKQ